MSLWGFPNPLTPFPLRTVFLALPPEYQWEYDHFLLIEYGEMKLCAF